LRHAAQTTLLRAGVLAQGFLGLEAQVRRFFGEIMRDTIDMALEAGCATFQHGWIASDGDLKDFEALVRADEREALLDLVDDYAKNNTDLKAAIRARGNT
jgi:hypothetical protein